MKKINFKKLSQNFILIIVTLLFASGCNSEKKQTGSQFEMRALWVDPPGFSNREKVDNLIDMCQRAGINTILPDVMLRENIYFKSENFVGNVNANDDFDPLAYLIEKAHDADIQVQAWLCTYYTTPKYSEWVCQPFASRNYNHVFLSPAHPEVNPYLLSLMEELFKYDIDGIHLDYTRYWNAVYDYSETARERFKAIHGFDPQNFYDFPEKIIAPEKEHYPIRVLIPDAMLENVAGMGAMERNLNHTHLGYVFISEKTENIDALRVPGMLMLSSYNNVSPEMAKAIENYAGRGGDIIWIDPADALFKTHPAMAELFGVSGSKHFNAGRTTLNFEKNNPVKDDFESIRLKLAGNLPVPSNARTIASINEQVPVVTLHKNGQSHRFIIGFPTMLSSSIPVIDLMRELIYWCKEEAGISDDDMMAQKRQQWIDWRADQILELVRGLRKMVDEKKPDILITAAAGVVEQDFYSVYRDGGQWIKEGLCDYIYPMNYSDKVDDFVDILDQQDVFMPEGMTDKIYPGLQIYKRAEGGVIPLDAEIVDQQIEILKQRGHRGFCLFAYSYFSEEIIEVVGKYKN